MVERLQLTRSNASAMIENRDHVVASGALCTSDVDSGARRRVLRSVLHELGEQMRHILRLVASDQRVVE